ncbi:hypothetical protein Gogos_019662 [Gossypium gossypioides]|uniref:Agenet domain-containing protein n=1 Tax=Gossypium gossypioides TaxID=34282 RepID=A0A7J9BI49_GOSGO|nr:hypothetical protein [Gossypium gossypioides]
MSENGKAIDAPATEDPPYLQPGSIVEVNPQDDDCPRAWYTAIIIERRATSTNHKRYVVHFTDLFQERNRETKPFMEYKSVDIRPLPPPLPPRKFKVGDIVEAYCGDGWYEGRIAIVLHDDTYIFQMSPMCLLVGVNQLRLHRTWFNGNWIQPFDESELAVEAEDSTEKVTEMDSNKGVILESEADNAEASKSGTGNILEGSGQITIEEEVFGEGQLVEVANDEDDFNQAWWFAATIVKPVGNNRYLIRYETLGTEGDTGFLEKEMNSLHIRPPPPHIPVPHQFKMFDNVNALYKGGWCMGVIIQVLSGGSKYEVYLDNQEKMEFKHSDLRLHQDWINGKWTKPSPGVCISKPFCISVDMCSSVMCLYKFFS